PQDVSGNGTHDACKDGILARRRGAGWEHGENPRTHGAGEKHHPDTAEEAERGAAGGPDCSCFSSCREGHGELLRIGPQAKIVGRVIISKAGKRRAATLSKIGRDGQGDDPARLFIRPPTVTLS